MTKAKKYMTFSDFKKKVTTPEGMAHIDAIVAQKILGMKVIKKDDGRFLRKEPKSDKLPRGGTYAIKQYTRNADAVEELITGITSGEVLVVRYYRNAILEGKPNKDARYEVIIKYRDENGKEAQVSQQGNNFSMNIITLAALLRWKGVLQEK